MVSNPITCWSVRHWLSIPRGIQCPKHKKTLGAVRPLEHGLQGHYQNLRHNRLRGWRDNKGVPSASRGPFLRFIHGRSRELLDFEPSKVREFPLRIPLQIVAEGVWAFR